MRSNDAEFVQVIMDRIAPGCRVRVIFDSLKSLQPSIELSRKAPDGKVVVAEYDLRLFIDRYEKHGIETGDKMTVAELRSNGFLPTPPPVSDGKGIAAPDPFAAPEGLPGADRVLTRQQPR